MEGGQVGYKERLDLIRQIEEAIAKEKAMEEEKKREEEVGLLILSSIMSSWLQSLKSISCKGSVGNAVVLETESNHEGDRKREG